MKSVFVTGASGFLGRHLCRALTERGVRVHGFSRSDGQRMEAAIAEAQPQWVFHLAADSRRDRDPALLTDMMDTNVSGTCHVIEAARRVGAEALVAVGSFEEYGDNLVPFREEMFPRPLSPYGMTKSLATLLVAEAGRWLVPATAVRFPVVYGPGQSADSFVGGACIAARQGRRFPMTKGEQTREFLFVADAVSALISAAESISSARGEIFNAGTGAALTLAEAVEIIGDVAGAKGFAERGALPYRTNEQMHYVSDTTKIAGCLGWKARTEFAEGIRLTLR